jgi:Flp pilus assembly protein TadB
MDEDSNIFVISKDQAIEILQEKTKNYFSGNTNKVNSLYITTWLVIASVIGIACLSGAALIILAGPFFLVEFIIRKIFNRRKNYEDDYTIDEE